MKGIRFYNEYGDEFELHSFGHFGRYPNFYTKKLKKSKSL